jgi:hypothetical protein
MQLARIEGYFKTLSRKVGQANKEFQHEGKGNRLKHPTFYVSVVSMPLGNLRAKKHQQSMMGEPHEALRPWCASLPLVLSNTTNCLFFKYFCIVDRTEAERQPTNEATHARPSM